MKYHAILKNHLSKISITRDNLASILLNCNGRPIQIIYVQRTSQSICRQTYNQFPRWSQTIKHQISLAWISFRMAPS